jgi:hypothetical protein
VSRVASEYTRVLYLVEKAKREDCALVGEVEWVRTISTSSGARRMVRVKLPSLS